MPMLLWLRQLIMHKNGESCFNSELFLFHYFMFQKDSHTKIFRNISFSSCFLEDSLLISVLCSFFELGIARNRKKQSGSQPLQTVICPFHQRKSASSFGYMVSWVYCILLHCLFSMVKTVPIIHKNVWGNVCSQYSCKKKTKVCAIGLSQIFANFKLLQFWIGPYFQIPGS